MIRGVEWLRDGVEWNNWGMTHLQNNSRVGVNVRPGILYFTQLQKDWRNYFVYLRNQFEERIVRQMF